MKRGIQRIAAIYRAEGLRRLLGRAGKKFARALFYTNSAFWFERDLSRTVQERMPGVPVEVCFDDSGACLAWMQQVEEVWLYNKREVGVAAIEQHWLPYLRLNGEIVGCVKVGFGRVYIADYAKIISLAPRTAFIYDTYILSELRNQHLGGFLLDRTLVRLQKAGVAVVGCHIPQWNTASLRVYAGAGFRKTKYVRHLRFMGVLKFELEYPVRSVDRVGTDI